MSIFRNHGRVALSRTRAVKITGASLSLLAMVVASTGCSTAASKVKHPKTPYFTKPAIPLHQATEVGDTFAPFGDQPSGGHGQSIDGIQANLMEADTYHTHVHLTMYVNGKQAAVPAGIGIVPPWTGNPNVFIDGGKALYWLHTHDNTGIIHIEAPKKRSFTLGNFFDIWGVKLTKHQFLNVQTPVTSFVDGILFKGNPRDIKLTPHVQITIELGKPVIQPRRYSWPADLLKTETVH